MFLKTSTRPLNNLTIIYILVTTFSPRPEKHNYAVSKIQREHTCLREKFPRLFSKNDPKWIQPWPSFDLRFVELQIHFVIFEHFRNHIERYWSSASMVCGVELVNSHGDIGVRLHMVGKFPNFDYLGFCKSNSETKKAFKRSKSSNEFSY